MFIESPANPTVKLLRSLDAPRAIKAEGLFVVEGVRAVEDGLQLGRLPKICLYSPALLGRTPRGTRLLAQLQALAVSHGELQFAEASTRALEAAAGTQHPQGVVAAFELPGQAPLRLPSGIELLGLVCDDIQDPGNLGTILRTAEAAGVQAAWLTPDCVYAYSPKVVRAGMGAHFRLAINTDAGWDQIGADLARARLPASRIFATEAQASSPYYEQDWRAPSVLIVSNEAHGLSAEAREFVTGRGGQTISIPMAGEAESLNASVAAGVILFEAARQRRLAAGNGGQ